MDIDGDGFSNVDEGEAGTDPKDASSFPEAQQRMIRTMTG